MSLNQLVSPITPLNIIVESVTAQDFAVDHIEVNNINVIDDIKAGGTIEAKNLMSDEDATFGAQINAVGTISTEAIFASPDSYTQNLLSMFGTSGNLVAQFPLRMALPETLDGDNEVTEGFRFFTAMGNETKSIHTVSSNKIAMIVTFSQRNASAGTTTVTITVSESGTTPPLFILSPVSTIAAGVTSNITIPPYFFGPNESIVVSNTQASQTVMMYLLEFPVSNLQGGYTKIAYRGISTIPAIFYHNTTSSFDAYITSEDSALIAGQGSIRCSQASGGTIVFTLAGIFSSTPRTIQVLSVPTGTVGTFAQIPVLQIGDSLNISTDIVDNSCQLWCTILEV